MVIGIIAILTVIIFPSIDKIRAKNRDAEKVSDIANIQLGLSMYYSQHSGTYPPSIDINNPGLVPKYFTADTLTPPDDKPYIYVPLKKGSDKCTYYHLGVELDLPSGQIDPKDNFTSIRPITNSYSYCDGYTGGGFSGVYTDNNLMYDVHP